MELKFAYSLLIINRLEAKISRDGNELRRKSKKSVN
jgi:hypothetical protein